MKNAKGVTGSIHFTVGELLDVGRRLDQGALERFKLLDAVRAAEVDAVWRLQAAAELARPLDNNLALTLASALAAARRQLIEPTRGQAKSEGGAPAPGGRTLPAAGTLIIRPRNIYKHRREIETDENGSYAYIMKDAFRFLVVGPPCALIWLDERGGPIYRSPSLAASKAARTQENGWDWFGIA